MSKTKKMKRIVLLKSNFSLKLVFHATASVVKHAMLEHHRAVTHCNHYMRSGSLLSQVFVIRSRQLQRQPSLISETSDEMTVKGSSIDLR